MYSAPKFWLNLLLRSTCFQGSSIFTKLPIIWRTCDIDDELLLSFHRTTELLLMVFHIKPSGCWEETYGTQWVEAPQAYLLSTILDKNTLPEMPAVGHWTGKSQADLQTAYRRKRGCHHLWWVSPRHSWVGRKDISENIGKKSVHSPFLFHPW